MGGEKRPAHALLSASSSERWINCPRSVRLTEHLPDVTSEFAAEGSLAHEIAELKLQKKFMKMPKSTFNSKLKKIKLNTLYHEEMLRHTDAYVDIITERMISLNNPHIIIEQKLDYSGYVPEGFGTADCIIISGNQLFVIDFKYGKGVAVSATDNSQMKLYALGAYMAYGILYDIKTISMVIVQPRLDSVSEFILPMNELLSWGDSIKPIAQQAFKGEGELKAGEHCKWCKIKTTCRARADHFVSLEDWEQKLPPTISNSEVGEVLIKGEGLLEWLNELKDYALSEIQKGEEVPGWKVVEGRSTRKITDFDNLVAELSLLGIPKESLYETKELAMTKVEAKLSDDKAIAVFEKYIEKPPGKPTLAKAGDKRPEFTSAANEFKGVNIMDVGGDL